MNESISIEVYCDESRQDLLSSKSKGPYIYSLIGGVWIPSEIRQYLKKKILELKEEVGYKREIKWKDVAPTTLPFFEKLLDLFFSDERIQFRCIVVDSTQFNLEKFHEGDAELGFYKLYYELLEKRFETSHSYKIYLDYKINRLPSRIRTLQTYLRNRFQSIKSIDLQALPSNEVVLIQLADVLLGATGYKLHNLNTSPAKRAIVERIEHYLGREIKPTSREEKKYNIFKIQLR